VTGAENVMHKTCFRLPNNHEFGKNEGRPAKAETGSTKSLELGVLYKAFRARNFGWEFIRLQQLIDELLCRSFQRFLAESIPGAASPSHSVTPKLFIR
jgi:hypothetical protein